MLTLTALLDALFPRRCPLCQATAPGLCGSCLAALPAAPAAANGAAAVFSYSDDMRELLRLLKFHRRRAIAGAFAVPLTDAARPFPADMLSFVPLHRARLAQRGYNQAELLARPVSRALKLPLAPALARIRDTPPLYGLTRAQRVSVLRGAFAPLNPRRYIGKSILLIDDIVTTGATMAECAKTLMGGGAGQVYCLSLSRTPWG